MSIFCSIKSYNCCKNGSIREVPENLQPYIQQADKIGAFIGEECRGLGTLVKIDSASAVFFVLIQGAVTERSKISFKYYSSLKSNMYATTPFLEFIVDGNYGTADVPKILNLSP